MVVVRHVEHKDGPSYEAAYRSLCASLANNLERIFGVTVLQDSRKLHALKKSRMKRKRNQTNSRLAGHFLELPDNFDSMKEFPLLKSNSMDVSITTKQQ